MDSKNFLTKLVENKHGTILPVHVTPGGNKFAIEGVDQWKASLKIRLSKKTEKGKANKELLKQLEKHLGTEVKLLSGEKSRQKILLVKATKKQLLEKLLLD